MQNRRLQYLSIFGKIKDVNWKVSPPNTTIEAFPRRKVLRKFKEDFNPKEHHLTSNVVATSDVAVINKIVVVNYLTLAVSAYKLPIIQKHFRGLKTSITLNLLDRKKITI